MVAMIFAPRSERADKPSRVPVKLHLLWLTCAAAGFAVTAVVACALALSSLIPIGF
ncbi:hypothetical protein ACO2Q3_03830 [Caulobacter sp. KR2-114]|uniref:hypothetical protein n=1 Tax=Caulobacter sp. KR2-114 TaxID=3400912 RepID=UPI003C0F36F0